jgi:hypothetical protein
MTILLFYNLDMITQQSADGRKIVALVAARLRADRAAYNAQLKHAAKTTAHTVSKQSSPVTAVVASSKADTTGRTKAVLKDVNTAAVTVDSSSAVPAVVAVVTDDINSVDAAADTDDGIDLAETQTTTITTDLFDTLAATASETTTDETAAVAAAVAASSGKCSYGRQAALVSKLPRTLMMVMTSDSIASSQQKQQQQQQSVRDTGEGLQAKAKAEAAIAAALKSKIAWETAARPKVMLSDKQCCTVFDHANVGLRQATLLLFLLDVLYTVSLTFSSISS